LKVAAKFEIPYYQYLNESGQLIAEPRQKLSDTAIKAYYEQILLTSIFDKRAISLQRTGKMGTYAPCTGQEAIGTAIGFCMEKEDVFVPYYRDYATMTLRGAKFSAILSYWGGDERSMSSHRFGQDFPICVPIASQCLHAAGVAHALKYKGSNQIALVTIGDGGTSEGDFYEAMNLAGVWNLPIVFVVLNNQWAISVPLQKQTACETIAQKAIAAGFHGVQVDGNDIFALHEVMSEAILQARGLNAKPILIEALTYRLSDHTTADDASRYRPQQEFELASPKAPLVRLEKYMLEQGLITTEELRVIEQRCTQLIDAEVDVYLNQSKPDIREVFDYQYANLPEYLIEQRATAIEDVEHANA
jgi:2-oxoisovalerate dehydrogenase E1 component alpha subunit